MSVLVSVEWVLRPLLVGELDPLLSGAGIAVRQVQAFSGNSAHLVEMQFAQPGSAVADLVFGTRHFSQRKSRSSLVSLPSLPPIDSNNSVVAYVPKGIGGGNRPGAAVQFPFHNCGREGS